jgi:hypothetical protein
VQIGDNRAAEWVRRSNPVALGLLFSGLAGQQVMEMKPPTSHNFKLINREKGNNKSSVLLRTIA